MVDPASQLPGIEEDSQNQFVPGQVNLRSVPSSDARLAFMRDEKNSVDDDPIEDSPRERSPRRGGETQGRLQTQRSVNARPYATSWGPFLQEHGLYRDADVSTWTSWEEARQCIPAEGPLARLPAEVFRAHANPVPEPVLLNVCTDKCKSLLAQLPLRVQATVLRMLMVSPFLWQHLEEVLMEMVITWPSVHKLASFHAMVQSQVKHFNVLLISCCGGLKVPILAAMRGLQDIINTHFQNIVVNIIEAWDYEVDQFVIGCAKGVSEKCPFQIRDRGSVVHAKQHLAEFEVRYPHFKVMILSGSPSEKITMGKKDANVPEGTSILHCSPTNLIFQVHDLLSRAEELFGRANVCGVVEFPPCNGHSTDEQILNGMFGPCTMVNSADWGMAYRKTHFRCNIPFATAERTAPPRIPMIPYQRELSDGYCWCPTRIYSVHNPAPVPLKSNWPSLVQYAYTSNCKVDAFQRLTLDCIRVRKGDVTRLGGVHFFCCYLGLQEELVAEDLLQRHPCHEFIHGQMGSKVASHHSQATACGESRFCLNCEQLLQRLGKCWDLAASRHVMGLVWTKSLSSWLAAAATSPEFSYRSCPVHVCGVKCSSAPR